MVDATVTDIVIAAPIAFFLGWLVGWVTCSRYRIVKRPDPMRDTPSGVWNTEEMRKHDRPDDT